MVYSEVQYWNLFDMTVIKIIVECDCCRIQLAEYELNSIHYTELKQYDAVELLN